MAEKKRKGAASVPAPPTKKSKKSVVSEPLPTTKSTVNEIAEPKPTANEAVTKSRGTRKRAADFLGEDETPAAPVSSKTVEKSSKKSKQDTAPVASQKKGKKASLTADGVNGVVEKTGDEEVEIATAKEPISSSLEAEALRTVDRKLEAEEASDGEQEDEDQGAALLAGFDSDGEDAAEDRGDLSKTQPIPQFKKTSKKLKEAKEKGSDGPGTVYVGRIPHGFYEQQMREYFTQFGDISRLRLSRNKRTGASKHFAFIEFASDEVAKIVADTMDNYLMFGHILKCKYAPAENLHPDVWKGSNKKYRKIPHDKLQRQQLEAPKTQEQWNKKNEKERKKRQTKAEQMKSIGYEYIVPELKNPADVVEQRKLQQEHGIPAATLTNDDEPNAIEAPPAVPADEVALEKSKKKEKKPAKSKAGGAKEQLTEGNLDARNAGPAAESAKILQNEEDEKNEVVAKYTAPPQSATSSKKSKKGKASSIATESSHNQFGDLSSIGVGIEAAPLSVTDAQPTPELDSIYTEAGVADTVLAGRKSDRKKTKPRKTKVDSTEAEVAEIAPGAVIGNKKEKKDKLKGILKKGTKA